MPIYEFICTECQNDFEALVRSSDWNGTTCPKCESSKLEKKLSVFAASGGQDAAMPECTGNPSGCGRCQLN